MSYEQEPDRPLRARIHWYDTLLKLRGVYTEPQRKGGSYISTNGETAVKALLAMAAKLGVEL